ncbi:MAG: RNA polymerase subunit sigma-70 [Flavobacteriaceae bacterium]|nr:MAG: RNA polymerase subunit sigma-70 [Flavobacteriaceae bacterium]
MKSRDLLQFCDEKVFSSFFTNQIDALHSFVFYKCGNNDLASDITQEAFVKFWENCTKIIPNKAKSYLFTIANNLFLNNYAKQKVRLNFEKIPQVTSNNESPEFLLEVEEFDQKLQNALNKLTEAQRIAFLLNRIDGKTYKEIALFLDISVKAVEKRIHKALKSLREEIKEL